MIRDDDCMCHGCADPDCNAGCWWPRGMTGQAPLPWSPDALDPIELPPRVVGLIEELSGNTKTPPSPKAEGRSRASAQVDRDVSAANPQA